MAALPLIGLVASLAAGATTAVGTIMAGKAAQAQGEAQQYAANLEAQNLNVRAKEERALAQRDAFELRRNKEMALSSLQAKSAASGFMPTDPSSLALADEISKYGTVQEQMAQYGGQSAARNTRFAAWGKTYEGQLAKTFGDNAMSRSYVGAAGSILGGIGGGLSQYSTMTRKPTATGRYG
jgi:hypothetical protein